MKSHFTIITPCLNAEAYIEETVLSVLQQTCVVKDEVELDYIICDGGSTDRTIEILRGIKHPSLRIFSEKDRGMYHALNKGFRKMHGEEGYVAYLNAGDYYHKCAFDVVADIFDNHPYVHWLTGLPTEYNKRSQIISIGVPYRYRRAFFANGFHGTRLPYLQQESTFWRANLLSLIDIEQISSYKLAGDYYLWAKFSEQHSLYIVNSQLAGFKRHLGQQSADLISYHKEVLSLVRPSRFTEICTAFFDSLVWRYSNDGLKRRLHADHHFVYDLKQNCWSLFSSLTKLGTRPNKAL